MHVLMIGAELGDEKTACTGLHQTSGLWPKEGEGEVVTSISPLDPTSWPFLVWQRVAAGAVWTS